MILIGMLTKSYRIILIIMGYFWNMKYTLFLETMYNQISLSFWDANYLLVKLIHLENA